MILGERARRQNLAAFHAEVILRAGERIIVAGLLDGTGGRRGRPKRIGSADGVGVEPFVRSGIASPLASVSQRKDDHTIGLTRQAPCSGRHFAVRKRNIDDVRINLAVLAAAPGNVVGQLQTLRCFGAD